ncbi:MAG: RtcB family protein [Actinomycetota bacterium]
MPKLIGNVLSWGSDVEEATIDQAQKAASLPIVSGHLALMPDAHIGIGATIGSVIPTLGAVIPAAVGVDIGCGVAALATSLTGRHLPGDLAPLHDAIRRAVPAGVGQGHGRSQEGAMAAHGVEIPERFGQRQRATVLNQFGSLGAGNHFVEVCLDEEDRVWLLLHSGSRGIGNQLAMLHVATARGLAEAAGLDLPDPDLAWLQEGTPAFDAYIADMRWAQRYAFANRAQMIAAILAAMRGLGLPEFETDELINNHHNFTQLEPHGGQEVWLTRKGAIPAAEGQLGIIPGSMGTRSYIVRGLGNEDSYCSCSHGAGRRMSRGRARRELSPESLTLAMVGRTWNSSDAAALVDEHPLAYKDVDQVMADQADLVETVHSLRAILNYKGVDVQGKRGRRP